MDELGYQAGIAIFVVEFINWMKQTQWIPFVNKHSPEINKVVAFVGAVIGALGIHLASNGDLSSGGTLLITYPPLNVMLTSFGHIALSWGMQQVYFRLNKAVPDSMFSLSEVTPRGGGKASVSTVTIPDEK
jgi:hypothetical protein